MYDVCGSWCHWVYAGGKNKSEETKERANNRLAGSYFIHVARRPRCRTFITLPVSIRTGLFNLQFEVLTFHGEPFFFSNEFLDENFYDSPSQAVLVDQIIAQPPQLFLMLAFIEMSRAAISSLPSAISRSSSLLGASVADSWKFWPLSVYLLYVSTRNPDCFW
jgi:hypothetical protein